MTQCYEMLYHNEQWELRSTHPYNTSEDIRAMFDRCAKNQKAGDTGFLVRADNYEEAVMRLNRLTPETHEHLQSFYIL